MARDLCVGARSLVRLPEVIAPFSTLDPSLLDPAALTSSVRPGK